jgi:hypothetical protein
MQVHGNIFVTAEWSGSNFEKDSIAERGCKAKGGRKFADEKTIRMRRRVGRNWFSIGTTPKGQPSFSRTRARKRRKGMLSWSTPSPN